MKTAHETYIERRKAIDAKIAQLQKLLRDFDEKEASDSANWGFAGSAGHVNEQLGELIAPFTGEAD